MILRAYYQDRVVLLNVPGGSLVYDGKEFVDPAKATWVELIYFTPVSAERPASYPVTRGAQYPVNMLTWETSWLCKVIGVENATVQPLVDVITEPIPADGLCICGVTCTGTEIQQVPIY